MNKNNELTVSDQNKMVQQRAERISRRPVSVPLARVVEDLESVSVHLDLPGVDEKSLDLTVEKNTLKIHASAHEPNMKKYSLYYAESRPTDYERAFILNQEINRENISASFKNGVLTITLPKGAYAKTRKIKVSTN